MTAGFTCARSERKTPVGKTKSRSGGLLDDVRSDVSTPSKHGLVPWHERVSAEHLAELSAIKAAWLAGELGTEKKPLARSISARLRERGIANIGAPGVLSWLEKT